MDFVLLFLCAFLMVTGSEHLSEKHVNEYCADCGEPLFLTPLIESGHIEEAKTKCLTGDLGFAASVESYSGLLTVNKRYNSNMFFWFFKSKNPKAPVLLWLQGGPGASSLMGLFVENGPYIIEKNLSLSRRKYSWTNEFSMLYIDNPVGAGFSFTENDFGYAKNETDVANDLYNALQQFFTLFSELRTNDFYVTGESYAGKYIPAIAHKIHTEKQANISMKGIAIGAGFIDPATMIDYGDFLYQVGLIDENQRQYFIEKQKKIISLINAGHYKDAFRIYDSLMLGQTVQKPYFKNVTGIQNQYNFLRTKLPEDHVYFKNFVTLPKTRKAIHVGNLNFNLKSLAFSHMIGDLMQSVKPWFTVLLDHYKVLIYNGQLDIIGNPVVADKLMKSVYWKHRDEYLNASRKIWKVVDSDEEIAGYMKKVKNFVQIVVRNAGHILPYDQPRIAYRMITNFVADNF